MSGFVIVNPQPVTDAVLTTSNVPETDAAAWAAGTTYALGALVMYQHSVYESAAAGNVGNNPATVTTAWTRVRATNRWRCFDGTNSSRTTQANSISYTFAPGLSVALVCALNMVNCTSVRVWLDAPSYGVVYDKTLYPGPQPIMPDPWEWAFGEWAGGQTLTLFDDLPSFPTAALHVDFVGGPDLAVGALIFGQPRTWGVAGVEAGAHIERKSYSRKEVNDYGDLQLVKRPSAKRASFELVVARAEVDPLQDFLDEIDATVCLFIGTTVFESTVIYGIHQDASVVLSSRDLATLSVEVLGVI